jgi:hypothetical protein
MSLLARFEPATYALEALKMSLSVSFGKWLDGSVWKFVGLTEKIIDLSLV